MTGYEDSDFEDYNKTLNNMKNLIWVWNWFVKAFWFCAAVLAFTFIWFVLVKITKVIVLISNFFWEF
jgi:hypothetical protein